jgi:hypothetical protein
VNTRRKTRQTIVERASKAYSTARTKAEKRGVAAIDAHARGLLRVYILGVDDAGKELGDEIEPFSVFLARRGKS